MPARGRRLSGRIVRGAVDLVSDRAPWLADQAYRAVATPLQWVDPAGAARAADTRLGGIRDQVAAMAARGKVGRPERRRLLRDLDRTRGDLERLAPRLPAVQARALAVRLDAYDQVLAGLPGAPRPPGARSRPTRPRDVAVVVAGGAAAGTGLLLPVAGTVVVEGGLAAGALTAIGVTAARRRRERRERIAALAAALAAVDGRLRGPNGADPRSLDGRRRALVGRALASGRLDARSAATLRGIDGHLDRLLVRLVEGELETHGSYLVEATVRRYLPDTLEPFLALPEPGAVIGGRPAVEEVGDQLASIEKGLADVVRQAGRHEPENLLLRQGDFLRSKFGGAPDEGVTADGAWFDGGMTSDEAPRVVSASREIAAAAELIFELIADPAQQPRWDGNDNLARAEAGQRVRREGDVFVMTMTHGGVRENRVVEFEEGRRIAWLPSEPGAAPPGHLWRWELEPVDAGRTLVTHTYDWSRLTEEKRLIRARATTSERLRASLDRLAGIAEGP